MKINNKKQERVSTHEISSDSESEKSLCSHDTWINVVRGNWDIIRNEVQLKVKLRLAIGTKNNLALALSSIPYGV